MPIGQWENQKSGPHLSFSVARLLQVSKILSRKIFFLPSSSLKEQSHSNKIHHVVFFSNIKKTCPSIFSSDLVWRVKGADIKTRIKESADATHAVGI